MGTTQWYALQIQSRLSNIASATLRGKGYEEFLPLYRSCRQWSDRVKQMELPLFPGYLFCRFDPNIRLAPVLTTPGVVSILGAGKTPIPVAEKEIEAVRRIVASGLRAEPWAAMGIGSRIEIARGPLAGLEGVVTGEGKSKSWRLVVSITLLQRSVAVEIDRGWARPLSDAGVLRN
jgi:transcription antitermination factor NusG